MCPFGPVANKGAWPPLVFKAHAEYGRATAIAFSADGRAVAVGDDAGRIQVSSRSGRPMTPILRHATGSISALAFGDGGRFLLSAGNDQSVRQWNLADVGGDPRRPKNDPQQLVQSLDGRVRLTFTERYDEGQVISVIDSRSQNSAPTQRDLACRSKALGDHATTAEDFLAVSSQGDRVAWVSPEKIKTWATGSDLQPSEILQSKDWVVTKLAFSADAESRLVGLKTVKRGGPVTPQKLRYRHSV